MTWTSRMGDEKCHQLSGWRDDLANSLLRQGWADQRWEWGEGQDQGLVKKRAQRSLIQYGKGQSFCHCSALSQLRTGHKHRKSKVIIGTFKNTFLILIMQIYCKHHSLMSMWLAELEISCGQWTSVGCLSRTTQMLNWKAEGGSVSDPNPSQSVLSYQSCNEMELAPGLSWDRCRALSPYHRVYIEHGGWQ